MQSALKCQSARDITRFLEMRFEETMKHLNLTLRLPSNVSIYFRTIQAPHVSHIFFRKCEKYRPKIALTAIKSIDYMSQDLMGHLGDRQETSWDSLGTRWDRRTPVVQ